MKKPTLKSALSGLMKPLSLTTKADKAASLKLNKLLSRTHLEVKPESLRPSPFSIEKSDLYHLDTLSETEKKAIRDIEKARKKSDPDTNFKVFRREVPIRDALVPHSVAEWSAGSKVDETIGPFQGIDGRQFWFDFFPVGTFTSLYKQGITLPVLLFQTKRFLRRNLPMIV